MLSKNMSRVLNQQIQVEFQASYVYLAMSAYCESLYLPGLAAWMRRQSEEEQAHAMRLFDFVLARGGDVVLLAVEKPEAEFGSPLEMFETVLSHEEGVTAKIHDAYKEALKETDHATEVELQWFITEQVEEEKTAGDIVARLKMIGKDTATLLMLDNELGRAEQE